jgi:hypothetical protein
MVDTSEKLWVDDWLLVSAGGGGGIDSLFLVGKRIHGYF